MRSFLYKNSVLLGRIVAVLLLIVMPVYVQADTTAGQYQSTNTGDPYQSTNVGGNYQSTNTGGNNTYTLQNPLAVNSISDLIALLLHAAIIIGIPIAVLFIVYAGFKFILARGSPGELSEARSNLVYTLIGVAIFIGASLIANVIIATLQQLGVQGINQL